MIRRSVSHPKFKEKFRIRSYGNAQMDSTVFLELKKKVTGVTYKRRASMLLREVPDFMAGKLEPANQIERELLTYFDQHQLRPSCLVSYDRIALYGVRADKGVDEHFRITFDFNIRYNLNDFDLTAPQAEYALTDQQTVLMEIKIGQALPLVIARLLSKHQIYQGKFTKYGKIYSEVIAPQLYMKGEKAYEHAI